MRKDKRLKSNEKLFLAFRGRQKFTCELARELYKLSGDSYRPSNGKGRVILPFDLAHSSERYPA